MAENTKIEWTDHTFNPWRGCTKVSPGCEHCYAETLSKRNPALLGTWGKGQPRVLASNSMWSQPLKWNAQGRICDDCGLGFMPERCARCEGPTRRPRVFCASLADVFDEEVPIEWLQWLLTLIDDTKNLDWLLLTKRPQNIASRMDAAMHGNFEADRTFGVHMRNVWLGTTVEDQKRADQRIPELLNISAAVHFLSCEPLLGPVSLHQIDLHEDCDFCGAKVFMSALNGITYCAGSCDGPVWNDTVKWVICGGESGPNSRPMSESWAFEIQQDCEADKVPFLFKQWGNHDERGVNVGKAKAGRLLMGKTYHAFPTL